jgi:DNA modification methylase
VTTAVPKRRRLRFDCTRCGVVSDAFPGTARAAGRICRDCFGKGVDHRRRELNDLTGKEWAQASRSIEEYPDTRSGKQREHGAAFPLSLARQQISVYTKRGDLVLDPFVGVGTTLDACVELGRRGIGIELNREFAATAARDVAADTGQDVVHGDALELGRYVRPGTVDFLLTSPPYAALLNDVRGAFADKWQEHSRILPVRNPTPYSDDPRDLGNMSYPDYLDAIERCLAESRVALRDDAYAAWVVKDFRALKSRVPYVPFHLHLVQRAESAGFVLWDIQIYDQTKFRPLVCLGYPSRNFYLNIGHSHIVILRKRSSWPDR